MKLPFCGTQSVEPYIPLYDMHLQEVSIAPFFKWIAPLHFGINEFAHFCHHENPLIFGIEFYLYFFLLLNDFDIEEGPIVLMNQILMLHTTIK